ncbi:PREDICTED: halilectin 3, alpha chain-like [Amphimedon queenslandica]|uniref:Uncharacterized protein n=1 Tax=Amphimedon queenslandica TaxID=400682 RepID=A0AAN0K4Q2_AMPQE|nr:PREDICTED: halilectin 3, alpha chain-like [Amphimedon queenslandica]|eukprot:XP_019864297.1 PREDICTED: halilectin 3, alpha chain-like [Amphimedon queenslandica]
MKCLFLVATLFVVVLSQTPQRRCREAPYKFSGSFKEVNYDARPGEVSFRFANISYSRTEMKIKVEMFERQEGGRDFVTETDLLLFTERTRYRVYEGHCTKSEIESTESFPDFGIPENATFFGSDYLGAEGPNLGVLVDNFYHRDGEGGDYHGSFAPVGFTGTVCWPVVESFVRRTPPRSPRPTSTNVAYEFMNLSTTLAEDAFEIPKECETPPPPPIIRGRNVL